MRVIRGDSYAAARARKLGRLTLAFFGTALVVCWAAKFWPAQALWMYMAAAMVGSLGFPTLKGWGNNFFGDRGERLTLDGLDGLGDEYTAVTNWVIPGTKQGDIDLLILGPHGALVCEIKTYSARYAFEGDNWYSVKDNGYRQPIKSPSRQLKRNAAALQKYMKANKVPGVVSHVLVLNDRIDLQHIPRELGRVRVGSASRRRGGRRCV
jgi:hypothetical protein